jgi:hypothetical protein
VQDGSKPFEINGMNKASVLVSHERLTAHFHIPGALIATSGNTDLLVADLCQIIRRGRLLQSPS